MDYLKSIVLVCLIFVSCQTTTKKQVSERISTDELFPWCIVAYDSVERTPEQRITMLKEFGFTKYAYDWRDKHLDDTKKELKLAVDNDIEVLSVWLWLNAKRDSIHKLSPANNRLFNAVEELDLKTTFWVSMSNNFFEELTDEESLKYAVQMIDAVNEKASAIGCKVALYNHTGWFGDIYNEIAIINTLPEANLSMVYNFHHGRQDMDSFDSISVAMQPYLSAVNLNGMTENGEKIMPIGSGDREKEMISQLQKNGFDGPWGILGHVENVDVKGIIAKNIEGLKEIGKH